MRPHVARFRVAVLAAFVAAFLAGFAAIPAPALAVPQLVRTLPSKATLIVRENRTRPVAAVQVWVRAGSRDEDRSERGAAAVLSQLVWEGNENRSKEEIDRVAGMVGGRYSSEVSTGTLLFEMEVPARFYGQALETLADIVLHPSFDSKSVENAKSLARTQSRNSLGHAVLASLNPLRDALHPGNALGTPVSVPEREIAAVTAPLVERFHQKWVTGDDITIVVVGDVDPAEAEAKATAAFASASKNRAPSRAKISEKPANGAKIVGDFNPDGSGGSAVTIGFRAPAWGTADALALDALCSLLGDYGDARIQRRLGEGPFLGASAQRSFEAGGGTVAFSIAVNPENLADAEGILFSEVERARFTPIDADEFRHAIDILLARDLVGQDDFAGIGRVTAYSAMQGKAGSDEVREQRIRALKPEDLVAVARQYLDPKQAVVLYMAPKSYVDSLHLYDGLEARAKEKLNLAAATYGGAGGPVATVSTPDERRRRVDAPLAAIPAAPLDAGRGRVTRATVDGIRVVSSEDRSASIVTIGVYLEGSVRHETEANNGITRLLRETMLTSSDPEAGGKSYRFSLPELGRFSPYQDRDMWGFSITVPASRWKETAKRLGAMLAKPEIDSVSVDATRLLVFDDQTRWLNDDQARRRQLIFSTKYEVSGYRLPLLGSRLSVVSISIDDVAAFYKKFVVKPNVVVAVFGDVKGDEVAPTVADAFRGVAPGPFAPGTVAKEGTFENFREKWELGEGPTCTVSFAFDGPPASSPEIPTLYVINSLFTNPRGWFQVYVREKDNAVRDLDSYVAQAIDESPIIATVTVPGPAAEEQAVKMVMGQFRSAAGIRLTGDYAGDLENAKRHALGLFQMGLASNANRAFQHARAEVFRLPAEYVVSFPTKLQSVTPDDVQRVAFAYFQYPDKGKRPYSIAETRPGGW
ncbi:MAG TPA: insulinase family protein [Candidatus Eisenbacteria bacterium]|nr:insulinase family protein [Candidatus Eisenbacteria bacterium]